MKFKKTTLSKQLSACEPCVCLDLHPMCGGGEKSILISWDRYSFEIGIHVKRRLARMFCERRL